MSALLLDILIYGASTAVGIGALTMVGRYYGRKAPPKPDETKPKENE